MESLVDGDGDAGTGPDTSQAVELPTVDEAMRAALRVMRIKYGKDVLFHDRRISRTGSCLACVAGALKHKEKFKGDAKGTCVSAKRRLSVSYVRAK